jgi:hypothetical protein
MGPLWAYRYRVAGRGSARVHAKPHHDTVSSPHRRRLSAGGGRSADARSRSRRDQGYRRAPISSDFSEPSDGLEPSTPSLPWRFRGVTRVHARSLATHFLLQIGLLQAVEMRRAMSQVSFLMCPFCVRAPSSDLTTTPLFRWISVLGDGEALTFPLADLPVSYPAARCLFSERTTLLARPAKQLGAPCRRCCRRWRYGEAFGRCDDRSASDIEEKVGAPMGQTRR